MKIQILVTISCFAGLLGAQVTQTETKTTTTTSAPVTLNGTLIDQGCYTTHTQKKESSSSDSSSTTTTTTTSVVSECPMTSSSTSFGMYTSDGKYVRLDDTGNARVIQMMKENAWRNAMENKKPVTVRVVGTADGGVVVVKEIK